jgi:predicted enzyme related to lactoylglutathione lyase
MAIIGTHMLVYTSEPEAVRAIFRDVFGWSHVDDGQGWLIFALPPAEIGVHPSGDPSESPAADGGTGHQITLMCDDIAATVADLRSRGIELRGEPMDQGWGVTIQIVLPGGLELMVYEPRHAVAIEAG